MQCYSCAEQGIQRPAVALCRVCAAGLCLEHLRETASRSARGRLLASCHHSTWDATGSVVAPNREEARGA